VGSAPDPAAALLRDLRRRIRDRRVLQAIAGVDRALFVPAALVPEAWDNVALPIAGGQTISQPLVVARMCELLRLRGDEVVLDVGTGSGYHAAVLARLAARVVSIERLPALSEHAARALAASGIDNVQIVVGDGSSGYPAAAPYDAINVAAAAAGEIPPALEAQLGPGGRLVVPVESDRQRHVLVRRRGERLERRELDAVRFVPLVADDA
jgi:protein-L-isoaspartate(D-aspartate) O-methyltransferase